MDCDDQVKINPNRNLLCMYVTTYIMVFYATCWKKHLPSLSFITY